MPVVAAVAAVVGAGISIYGSISAANAKAEAMRKDASLRDQQAAEELAAGEENSDTTLAKGTRTINQQEGAYAASGVDIGSGSPLLVYESTLARSRFQASEQLRAARFRAFQIQQGASQERQNADDGQSAAVLQGVGQGIGAIGSIANASGETSKVKTTTASSGGGTSYSSSDVSGAFGSRTNG